MKRLVIANVLGLTVEDAEKAINYTKEYFKNNVDMFEYDLRNYFEECSDKEDLEEKQANFEYDAFVDKYCRDECIDNVQGCICEALEDKIDDMTELEVVEKAIKELTQKDFSDIATEVVKLIGDDIEELANDIAKEQAESIDDHEWQQKNKYNSNFF